MFEMILTILGRALQSSAFFSLIKETLKLAIKLSEDYGVWSMIFRALLNFVISCDQICHWHGTEIGVPGTMQN